MKRHPNFRNKLNHFLRNDDREIIPQTINKNDRVNRE